MSERLTATVVIATCNRPDPLRGCLDTLASQTFKPDLVIVVDSSDGDATAEMIQQTRSKLRFSLRYERSGFKSAARQRNFGAGLASSDVIVFLDDDVVLEASFLDEVMKVFLSDPPEEIGGVSGTISNEVYSNPHGLNRFLLGFCLGQWRGSYAGKLLGPAVNFLPAGHPGAIEEVEWLPSTCTAYRRNVFLAHRFGEDFEGYSFAEDVHLSSRVHKTHRLFNTVRARVFHHDLGKSTHKDWKALGESMVVNRHAIMADVLGRNRIRDHARLLAFELGYSSLAWLAAGANSKRISILAKLLHGKLSGFLKIWSGPTPRQPKQSIGRAEIS